MKLKVYCKISRRIGKDEYVAGTKDNPGRRYEVDAERAGKYAEYFIFANSEDQDAALAAFEARKVADDEAWRASQQPAFSIKDLAKAVAQLLHEQEQPALKGAAR